MEKPPGLHHLIERDCTTWGTGKITSGDDDRIPGARHPLPGVFLGREAPGEKKEKGATKVSITQIFGMGVYARGNDYDYGKGHHKGYRYDYGRRHDDRYRDHRHGHRDCGYRS